MSMEGNNELSASQTFSRHWYVTILQMEEKQRRVCKVTEPSYQGTGFSEKINAYLESGRKFLLCYQKVINIAGATTHKV